MSDDVESVEEAPAASPVLVAMAPSRTATAVAFVSRGWAGATWARQLASGAHDPPRVLGVPDRTSPDVAPQVFGVEGGVGVVWAEPEGVFVTTLDKDGAPPKRPAERIAPSARALALAAGRSSTRVVVWDGRRVTATTLDGRGVPSGERETWLERAGKSARLTSGRVGAGAVAVIAFDDEPAIHVLSHDGDKARAVRHDVGSPVSGLAMCGAGNRGGLVLVLSEGERVAVAELDPAGRFLERPSTRLEGQGVRWDAPVALFVEDGFAALVRDTTHRTASLHAFASRSAPLVTLDRIDGAPAAAWHEKRLWVATASEEAGRDEVVVQIQRATVGARKPALVTPFPIRPPLALLESRANERAVRVLVEAASELSTTTYRDVGEARAHVDPEEAELRLGSLRTTIEVEEGAFKLWLVARAPDATVDPVPAGSFDRLGRWLRLKLSKAAWDRAVAEQLWVDSLAAELGGRGTRTATDGGTVVVFALATLPAATVLARWIRRVQQDLRARMADSITPKSPPVP